MRFLVHCHVFYPELWEELEHCVSNLHGHEVTLFVTLVRDDELLKKRVLTTFPDARIEILENRGYDIAPFIYVLNKVNLGEFDFIVKLHTKRDIRNFAHHVNYRSVHGKRWRRLLLAFLATPENLHRTLGIFATDPRVGMIGSAECWLDYDRYGLDWDSSFIEPELRRLGISTRKRGFLSGTMFICRAELFRKIQHRINFSAFSTDNDHSTTLAHAYEMLFGVLIHECGYTFADYRGRPVGSPPFLKIRKLWFRILHRLGSFPRNEPKKRQ